MSTINTVSTTNRYKNISELILKVLVISILGFPVAYGVLDVVAQVHAFLVTQYLLGTVYTVYVLFALLLFHIKHRAQQELANVFNVLYTFTIYVVPGVCIFAEAIILSVYAAIIYTFFVY